MEACRHGLPRTGIRSAEGSLIPTRILQIASVALLLWLVWTFIDFAELRESLRGIAPATVGVLLVLATLDRLAMAFKWRQLVHALGVQVRAEEFVSAYYASSFLSYFLPTTLGGELYRGYRISRHTGDPARVTASMVAEKMIGVLATVVLAWLGLGFLIWSGMAQDALAIFALIFLLTLVAFAAFSVSMSERLHAPLLSFAERWPRLAGPLRKLSNAYVSFSSKRSVLTGNFVLAVLENALQLAIVVGAALALGVSVSLFAFAAIAAVSRFLMRVSMVLDGWGISEAVRVVTYGLIGMGPTEALAIALVAHAAVLLASLPGAFVFFLDPARKNALASEVAPT